MQILQVKWLDTVSQGDEWVESEDIHSLAEITSVGILLKEDEQSVTLVLSLSEDNLVRGYVCIPKTTIIQRKELNHGLC
jgi:hypothetical protein